MVEIKWTLQSIDDLESIFDFIAKDSPQYARLFVVDILEAVHRLTKFPNSGRVVPELNNSTAHEYWILRNCGEMSADKLKVIKPQGSLICNSIWNQYKRTPKTDDL